MQSQFRAVLKISDEVRPVLVCKFLYDHNQSQLSLVVLLLLVQGFECGISSGDTGGAFLCALHHIRTCLIASENLPSLLQRTEYYLGVMNKYGNTWAETHIMLYRDTILMLMGKMEMRYVDTMLKCSKS